MATLHADIGRARKLCVQILDALDIIALGYSMRPTALRAYVGRATKLCARILDALEIIARDIGRAGKLCKQILDARDNFARGYWTRAITLRADIERAR